MTTLAATVGMPATYGIGADAYAMVVTDVTRTGHIVKARRVVNGEAVGATRTFTRRANGKYRPKGANYGYLALGVARDYLDPSF